MADSELERLGKEVQELVKSCRDFAEMAGDSQHEIAIAMEEWDHVIGLLDSDWSEMASEDIEITGYWSYTKIHKAIDGLEAGHSNVGITAENALEAASAAEGWIDKHLGG